jgi:precorrin-6B methylase 2
VTAEPRTQPEPATPNHILDIGFAFRKSKALLSALELDLFTTLADGPLDAHALTMRLGLHGRGALDFFDALVTLGLLDRDAGGRYANTPDGALYLDRRKPTYIGGLLEYLNVRSYRNWGHLTQALRTGMPQSGGLGRAGFAALHADPAALDIFLTGMTGGSLMPARTLAASFPWHAYRTVIDIGAAQGCVPVEIARVHPHLTGGGFDLPALRPAFTSYVHAHGLGERLKFHSGDFFNDPLPRADVLIMGRILHDWDDAVRKLLVQKAQEALPPGGALIVYDALIDNERRARAHSLLASLNMLIETEGGSEYSDSECMGWMAKAGFEQMRVEPAGPMHWAVIATKAPRLAL